MKHLRLKHYRPYDKGMTYTTIQERKMSETTNLRAQRIALEVGNDRSQYLDLAGVCERYKVPKQRWLAWCREAIVPAPVRVNTQIRWSVASLVAWDWIGVDGQEAWNEFEGMVKPVDVNEL